MKIHQKITFSLIFNYFLVISLIAIPLTAIAGDCTDGNIYGPDYYGPDCPIGSHNVTQEMGFHFQTGNNICACTSAEVCNGMSYGEETLYIRSFCLPDGISVGDPGWEYQVFFSDDYQAMCQDTTMINIGGYSECDSGAGCCNCESLLMGECSGGSSGDEFGSCVLNNLNYPDTVIVGETFFVTYDFLGTGPNDQPYEVREPQLVGVETQCIYGEDHLEGVWHNDFVAFTCPDTPGDYTLFINCGASEFSDNTDCGKQDDFKTGTVSCVNPPSIGHIRIWDGSQVIKLNIISATDAVNAGSGVVKIAMTAGDTGSAADLVDVNHPNASPVRVQTSFGKFAWRLAP